MTSKERVLASFEWRRPDRIPTYDNFWQFPDTWRRRLGDPEQLSDVVIWTPNEGTFPTRAGTIKEDGDWIYRVDEWGRTLRSRRAAYFEETLTVPMPPGMSIDAIEFDPPGLDSRFDVIDGGARGWTADSHSAVASGPRCVFGKTGGPYLRSTYVRGETQFLMDIAGDCALAQAIADKVADHLLAVGLEELQRWDLADTGIWIFDDMAYNTGPMFSPRSFESVFLPAYRRMIRAYKDAGARHVGLHSDGNILPILDMLVDAGIDALNPLERRAGMDIAEVRRRYPELILVGGMCNSETLVNGPLEKIRAEAREIIDLGRDGGIVIGTHSISPEIPLAHYVAYHETCMEYGDFGNCGGQ